MKRQRQRKQIVIRSTFMRIFWMKNSRVVAVIWISGRRT